MTMPPDSPEADNAQPADHAVPRAPGWTLWLPLALFAGFAGLVTIGLVHPANTDVPSQMIGKPLPAFALPAAVAERPGLANTDLATGHPRLLNIFASWCIPCAVEAPVLGQLAAQGVEIDGIAIRDHRADLTAFLARNGDPYRRLGADNVSAVQLAIGSSGVPETFIIDKNGVLVKKVVGPLAWDSNETISFLEGLMK